MDTHKVLLEHQKLIIILILMDKIFYRFFSSSRPVERSCILSHSLCMPPGGAGFGGVSLICSYISLRRLRPFLGFKILNFNSFGIF